MFLMRASSYLKTMLFFMFVMGTMFNAAAPVMNLAVIFPNPAYANSTLVGYCNATTVDSAYISYNYTWYLNGMANISGNTGADATGGTISYSDSNGLNPRSSPPYVNGYTIHSFTTSGTLSVGAPMNVSALVVAGGGFGAQGSSLAGAGGGGAGGLLYNASYAVSAGSNAVTVGNGGVFNNNNGKGVGSSFGALNAVGGGGGAVSGDTAYVTRGGSGGGSSCAQTSGIGTVGQGNNGGQGSGTIGVVSCSGGGGGGAGGLGGTTYSYNSGGTSGIGLSYSISGLNITYATGGAGAPINGGNGIAGTANTGNGGGGGGRTGTWGAGGSGIVIIRYPTKTYPSGMIFNAGNISNTTLAVGQNWTLQCTAYNANGASAPMNSAIVTILSPFIAPNASTFGGASSTNLSNVSDLTNVTNLTLETIGKGKIQFPPDYSVNAVAQDYDAHVKIENGFVSVNSSALDSSFNAPAQLEINASGVYSQAAIPVIKYYSGFATDIKTIIRNGVVCPPERCTNIAWNNVTHVLTFNVSGFSGYAISDTSYGYDAELGINITSTNQIAIYTSNGLNDTVFDFKPVTPPAGSSVTLMSNETSNTTTGEIGFLVQNQGNVNVSINVSSDKNASAFIGGTASLFQMFGAENGTGACADINTSAQDLGATGKILCPSLRFTDSSDTINSFILIKIDSDSPPRSNKAVLTFTSTEVQ